MHSACPRVACDELCHMLHFTAQSPSSPLLKPPPYLSSWRLFGALSAGEECFQLERSATTTVLGWCKARQCKGRAPGNFHPSLRGQPNWSNQPVAHRRWHCLGKESTKSAWRREAEACAAATLHQALRWMLCSAGRRLRGCHHPLRGCACAGGAGRSRERRRASAASHCLIMAQATCAACAMPYESSATPSKRCWPALNAVLQGLFLKHTVQFVPFLY